MKKFFLLIAMVALAACSSTGGNNEGGTNPVPDVKFDCQNPVGGIVKHGEVVNLFKTQNVPYGQACVSEARTCNNGVLSGTATYAACEVLPESEPAGHEQPMKISDEGLKMGGIKSLGVKYVIQPTSRQFSPKPPPRPICQTIPVIGSECQKGMPVCQTADDQTEYSCEPKETYKIFGWIYEKNGLDYSKMAEGVKVDVFWFAGCWVGFCDSMAGPVYTDKWGYFEFTTGTLMDTLRLDGLPKYYMFCDKGKPIAGGGQYISTDFVGKAIGPFKQLVNAEGVCEQNFLMKMFAEEEAPKNPNDIFDMHPMKLK